MSNSGPPAPPQMMLYGQGHMHQQQADHQQQQTRQQQTPDVMQMTEEPGANTTANVQNDLQPGTRHKSKDDIYSLVYLLHRRINASPDGGEDEGSRTFYARKSDKMKLLLRCGKKTSACQFRIKARNVSKDNSEQPWLVTVADLTHTCTPDIPASIPQAIPPAQAKRGTRMKTAYLNNVIVKHVAAWLRKQDDPFNTTAEEIKQEVSRMDQIGAPKLTLSTARRVLSEALLQMGVTNHDDFSGIRAWAHALNSEDNHTVVILQGLRPEPDLIRDMILSGNYSFDESSMANRIVTLASREMLNVHDGHMGDGSGAMVGHRRSVADLISSSPKTMYYRCFVAPGMSIRAAGFLRQHVVTLYAEPCSGKYRGALMSAMTIGGDGGAILLAYAHVITENEQNWRWFLNHLLHCFTGFMSSGDLVVVSNWGPGLNNAVSQVLSSAHHALCLETLINKLVGPDHTQDGSTLQASTKAQIKAFLCPAAMATSLSEHNSAMTNMESNSAHTYSQAKQYPVQAWAAAHINSEQGRSSFGVRSLLQRRHMPGISRAYETDGVPTPALPTPTVYDLLDWHEISNKAIRMPVPKLLSDIYEAYVQGWKAKADQYANFRGGQDPQNLSAPEAFPSVVLCKLLNVVDESSTMGLQVINSFPLVEQSAVGTSWLVGSEPGHGDTNLVKQVVGRNGVVCSCGRPQATGLPCAHVVAVAVHDHRSSRNFIHSALSAVHLKLACDAALNPSVTNASIIESIEDPSILPPLAIDQFHVMSSSTTRKKHRMRSLCVPDIIIESAKQAGHEDTFQQFCARESTNSRDHCSRCLIRGHHVSTCSCWGVLPGSLNEYFTELNTERPRQRQRRDPQQQQQQQQHMEHPQQAQMPPQQQQMHYHQQQQQHMGIDEGYM